VTNTELNALAEVTWDFGCNVLRMTGELTTQVTLVQTDGQLTIAAIAGSGPPRLAVRALLKRTPSQAFVFISEAFGVAVPEGRGTDAKAALAFRRTLPANLAEYHGAGRRELLLLTAIGRDFSLIRQAEFHRGVDGQIAFGPALSKPDVVESAFLEMRELLHRAEEQPKGKH
jgi:hypothetical protein